MRKYCQAAVSIALLLAAAGCGDFFVSPGTVVAIKLTPVNPEITPSKTQQFTATATLGDGTTKDISTTATWTSSATNIATISATGLATAGTSTGSTVIS